MLLILSAAFAVGVGAHAATAALGARLALRLGLAVTAAYAAFFLLVRVWLAAMGASSSSRGELVGDLGAEVALEAPSAALEVAADGGAGELAGAVGALDEAPVHLVDGVVALLLSGAALLVWNAPLILTEATFELALVGALGARARDLTRAGWTGSLLRTTVVPYALTLAIALAVGWAAHAYCPAAERLRDVFTCVG
jgi:hypothetical protein